VYKSDANAIAYIVFVGNDTCAADHGGRGAAAFLLPQLLELRLQGERRSLPAEVSVEMRRGRLGSGCCL